MSLAIKPVFRFKYDPGSLTDILADHLYNLREDSAVVPFRLFVYPSALCNDSCRYCSDGACAGSESAKDFLRYEPTRDFFADRKYIDKLINDIKELEIRDIHLFGGGEPFFYKENMFYFLERLKDTDIFIRIITNANNLDSRDVDYIVKNKLISSLNISLNTDSEETAKKLYTDSSRHAHSLSILDAIVKCKGLYGTDFPRVNIMSILLNVNYDKISDIIHMIGRYKIAFFSLQPLRCGSDNQNEFMLSKEQEESFTQDIPRIEEKLNEFKIVFDITEFKKEGKNHSRNSLPDNSPGRPELKNKNNLALKCYLPLITLAISYNGNIPFCFFKYDKQYKNNYFELNSLKEFIYSREYAGFVKNLINFKLPEICADCHFCSFYEFETMKKRFKSFENKR